MQFFIRSQRPVRKNHTVMPSTSSSGWCYSEPRLALNRIVVLRYRFSLEQKNLAPSTINVRLAAVRRLAYEASDSGLLSPELAAGIRRVKGAKRQGVRIGNWLTVNQSRVLLQKSPSDGSEANVIGRFWRCSSDAACDGPNRLDSKRKISRSARSTG
jgi:hypothetical protein